MLHLIRFLFLLYDVKAVSSILNDNGPKYNRAEPIPIPQTPRRLPTTETQTVIQTDGAVAFTYALISFLSYCLPILLPSFSGSVSE